MGRLTRYVRSNRFFVVAIVIASLIWTAFAVFTIANNIATRDNVIELETTRSVNQYQLVLNKIFRDIDIIETYVNTTGIDNLTTEDFQSFGELNHFTDVGFVSFSVAPEGVIEYYYSDAYGQDLIGLDLVHDERDNVRNAVEYAIDNEVIVVNGPFDLLQGEEGIVFRKPLYDNGEFIGLINFVVDYNLLNNRFNENGSDIVDVGVYDSDFGIVFGDVPYSQDVHYYEKIKLEYVDWSIGIQVSGEYSSKFIVVNTIMVILFIGLFVVSFRLWGVYYKRNKDLIGYQDQLIHYDNLTNLPNRRLFKKDTLQLISDNTPFYLGFGDLDNFKNINDVLGHSVGDKYLQSIASRLTQLLSHQLRVYRWGGDEFIFIFLGETKSSLLQQLDRIFDIFHTPLDIKDTKHQISISIGLVQYPKDGNTLDDLVKRADIVMYDIKAHYKNTYSFFEQEYLDQLVQDLTFQQELEKYDVDDFEIYLQPIVDVQTNTISGFEGLSRIFNTRGIPFDTARVIKLYEQDGTITKLDKYVFRTLCECIERMDQELKQTYFVTFNISPLSLTPDYIQYLERTLRSYRIDSSRFVIEIIETLGFKDVTISIELLERIKRLGFRIAMDDFGMGYSSLSYLAKLPLDIIKVDKSFVHNYETDTFNRTILRTIKYISTSLSLDILVEGIETESQKAFIQTLGAQYYQGYLYSKPASLDAIIAFVKTLE